MQIETIKAYHVVQPFVDGPYRMSKGREADAFDAVIVSIASDSGITGWGEMAPLGNFYSAAFPAGVRAGVVEIAPHLIGHDPRGLANIGRLMDTVFKGHPYIKSALDMACWDLAGRAADVPLVTLLGGKESDTAELYKVVTHGSVDAMAALAKRIVKDGFHRLQVKVGGNVHDDIERVTAVAASVPKGTVIFCDANAGWTPYQARQFADATRAIDYTFEQPCTTIDENMSVRRMLDKPMVLDESVTSLEAMLEIHRLGAADGLTLKISRLGGVTKTR
nr:mandelate racemase/muconate lactonizing enzyme family protein [Mesorhizobium sp. M7A.F.Ca.CA.001.07.2.1]